MRPAARTVWAAWRSSISTSRSLTLAAGPARVEMALTARDSRRAMTLRSILLNYTKDRSRHRARMCAERAAEEGSAQTMRLLASMLLAEDHNNPKAVELLQRADEVQSDGSPACSLAMGLLGICYAQGCRDLQAGLFIAVQFKHRVLDCGDGGIPLSGAVLDCG